MLAALAYQDVLPHSTADADRRQGPMKRAFAHGLVALEEDIDNDAGDDDDGMAVAGEEEVEASGKMMTNSACPQMPIASYALISKVLDPDTRQVFVEVELRGQDRCVYNLFASCLLSVCLGTAG